MEALATNTHAAKTKSLITLYYCKSIIFLLILRMRRNKYQGREEKKIKEWVDVSRAKNIVIENTLFWELCDKQNIVSTSWE